MHGPTGNITVLSTYGRKYGENKWSKLHSYFFWKQFKHMILNFFCPVYILTIYPRGFVCELLSEIFHAWILTKVYNKSNSNFDHACVS